MARFPIVDGPCPYKSQFATMMDGDMCRLCKRQVFNLTDWSDGERAAFLAGCAEEVCVSYRLPLRLAAAALAASAMAVPGVAAAQNSGAGDERVLTVGGIKDPRNARFVEAEADSRADEAVPELPIVYEDETPVPAQRDRPSPAE